MRTPVVATIAAICMSFATTASASHPHQSLCVVASTTADGESIQFLIEIESSREYVNGDPNKDVHDFRYQVRVCDDDNDSSSCSTYQSKKVSHAPTEEVTLVGMKDTSAVFFRGRIALDGVMEGAIVHQGAPTKSLAPFTAKLDKCVAQSWVKLAPEADSKAY